MRAWWATHKDEVYKVALIAVLAVIAGLTYRNNQILVERNAIFREATEERRLMIRQHETILEKCGG